MKSITGCDFSNLYNDIWLTNQKYRRLGGRHPMTFIVRIALGIISGVAVAAAASIAMQLVH